MANSSYCSTPRAGPVTRPHWKAGSYLTAAACATEQNYFLQRYRRHNREMHGWGVLCGLWVIPAGDGSHPWAVNICPGFAVGPYGDEIELLRAVAVNIEDYVWFRPEPVFSFFALPVYAYVVLRYQDWLDGIQALPSGACECKDPVYVESRTGDGYQAGVIWTPPEKPSDSGICKPDSQTCPPCPDSPWVTLARITMPQSGNPITAAMIDNGIRTTL